MKAAKTPDFKKQVRVKPAFYTSDSMPVSEDEEAPPAKKDLYSFSYTPPVVDGSVEDEPVPQSDASAEPGLSAEDMAFFEEHKIPLYNEKHTDGQRYDPYRLLNKRVSLSFFGTTAARILAILLFIILTSPLILFAVGRVNDYFYVKSALDQAKLFNNAGNYQSASVLLLLTDGRWTSTQMRADIQLERNKARAGVDKLAQPVGTGSAAPSSVAADVRKKTLQQIVTNANGYLGATASSLRSESNKLFNECLATWQNIQAQFPGSSYADYREGCTENQQTYLNNISADEKKFTYLKLQADYLLKKLDAGQLNAADEALYEEIIKALN